MHERLDFLPARCMTPDYATCAGQELENFSASSV